MNENSAIRNLPAGQAGPQSAIPRALPAAAGIGIGALLMALLEGYPAVVPQVVAWGPTTLVLVGLGWFTARLAPPFVGAQLEIARSMTDLTAAVRERFRQEDDVRMAVRALAAKLDDVLEEVRRLKP